MDIYTATEEAYKRGLEDGKPKWISVKERLPDSGGIYLVYFADYDGIKRVWYGQFVKPCNWFTYDVYGCSWGDKVTHWMPLPEAPKEVKR